MTVTFQLQVESGPLPKAALDALQGRLAAWTQEIAPHGYARSQMYVDGVDYDVWLASRPKQP